MKQRQASMPSALLASMATIVLTLGGGALTITSPSANADEPETCSSTADFKTKCDGFYYAVGGKAYTASGLKTVSNSLSELGRKSPYYDSFHNAMMQDTGRAKLWLHDSKNPTGTVLTMRLVGINQDTVAGTGMDTQSFQSSKVKTKKPVGLTFQALQYNTTTDPYWTLPSDDGTWSQRQQVAQSQGTSYTTSGGWGASVLRRNLNSGPFWNALPESVKENLVTVLKKTNSTEHVNQLVNNNSDTDDSKSVTDVSSETTADKVWVATPREVGLTNEKPADSNAKYWGWFPNYNASNDTYEFWSTDVSNGHSWTSPDASLSGKDDLVYYTSLRAPSPRDDVHFAYAGHDYGNGRYLGTVSDVLGVVPMMAF